MISCFAKSYAEGDLGYYITAWFGPMTSANKVKPNRIIMMAAKIMGSMLNSIDQQLRIKLCITRHICHVKLSEVKLCYFKLSRGRM